MPDDEDMPDAQSEAEAPETDAPDTDSSGRRRGRWLAAALVGAAAPGVVPATHAAAAPATAPVVAHSAAPMTAPVTAPAATRTAAPEQLVTVRRGDTVGAIARRTGSSVAAIVAANGLSSRARIIEGQQLRIPDPAAPVPTARPSSYTVRAGDTLTSIAAAHRTSVVGLRRANGLDARGFIREGQVLRLSADAKDSAEPKTAAPDQPAKAAPTDQSAPVASYTVRAGDTLSRIARTHGTTVAALRAANNLRGDGFIRIGQVLTLQAVGTVRKQPAEPTKPPTPAAQPTAVSSAVALNRSRLAMADVPSRTQMKDLIRSTAVRLGVDPSLALAVAYQESGFNMAVVSSANAIGAMQVIPSSGVWASGLLGEELDLFDPEDNVKAGVAILRTLSASNPPDIAIASYYQGNASVRSRGMYDDTRRYVANVQTLQAQFR